MQITILDNHIGKRLDVFVTEILKDTSLTRTIIQQYLGKGCSVNGQVCKRSYKLKEGDTVEIDNEYWSNLQDKLDLSKEIVAQKKELDIRYEDSNLFVIYKPKGVVVHPGVNNTKDTLANYIRYYLESKDEYDNLMDRCGIVHRLDKGVSGLMVVAKNKKTQDYLKTQFKQKSVIKIYLAELEKGKNVEQNSNLEKYIKEMSIEIEPWKNWQKVEGYIGRSRVNRFKMEFKRYEFSGSKYALSYIYFTGKYALIKIETGRMHQIRSTLEYLGYTIKGDNLYGNCQKDSEAIMLEAILLSFVKPDGQRLTLKTY